MGGTTGASCILILNPLRRPPEYVGCRRTTLSKIDREILNFLFPFFVLPYLLPRGQGAGSV